MGSICALPSSALNIDALCLCFNWSIIVWYLSWGQFYVWDPLLCWKVNCHQTEADFCLISPEKIVPNTNVICHLAVSSKHFTNEACAVAAFCPVTHFSQTPSSSKSHGDLKLLPFHNYWCHCTSGNNQRYRNEKKSHTLYLICSFIMVVYREFLELHGLRFVLCDGLSMNQRWRKLKQTEWTWPSSWCIRSKGLIHYWFFFIHLTSFM